MSDAISRSRKHGVTILFHLSKLNWFGKLYIKVTRQNGRPSCLDGHQAVGKASLARSSQHLKQTTIMINHPGGSGPAPNTVSARIAAALHLSAFKIYWKNTWKNKILIKFQTHVGFWILWKQCTSTSNTLAWSQTQPNFGKRARIAILCQHCACMRKQLAFERRRGHLLLRFFLFALLQLVLITKSSMTGHRTWETFATLILGVASKTESSKWEPFQLMFPLSFKFYTWNRVNLASSCTHEK